MSTGYLAAYRAGLQPEPQLTVSEWADAHRILTGRSSAEPGPWRTSRFPFAREIMDALSAYSEVRRIVFQGGRQIAKALALDTPIATKAGWTTMGEIKVGDVVFDVAGRPTRVRAVSGIFHGNDCFRVTFSDGSEIVADAGHLWAVIDGHGTGRKARPRILTTEEMAMAPARASGPNRHAVSICGALKLPKADLPIAPYVFGYWLGDGNSASNQLTIHEDDAEEIRRNIEAVGHVALIRTPASYEGRHAVNVILDPRYGGRGGRGYSDLAKLGVISAKHIPGVYLWASEKQRVELLRGLMDADGTVGKKGHCRLTLRDDPLAEDALELVRGLGFKPTVRRHPPKSENFPTGPYLCRGHVGISFRAYADRPVFRLARKAARLPSRASGLPSKPARRRIVAVQPVPSVPTRCISVDSPSHLFLAGRALIPTHNSEIGLNWIGYVIHHAPGPMLLVEPSVDMAKKTSRQRITPMIEETPALHARIPVAHARAAGNNIFIKEFPGGMLMLTGSNSSAALRSTPIRYLFANEADEYPDQVEDKGSALSIAEACTNNFPNRKVYITGNPGIRGSSRIEREFLRGDRRRYYIPCPRCGAYDFLTWGGYEDHVTRAGPGHHLIAWDEGAPKTAHMRCGPCGGRVAEHEKEWMLPRGEWRPTATGDGDTRSYHLSSLYSPFGFKSWGECAVEFLAKKDDPTELRSFVNEVLGETWEERADRVEVDTLLARLERYDGQVPAGVGVLTAAVDVQGDRLECVVKGYGAGEESWLIEWEAFLGDPADPAVWLTLDRYLTSPFTHCFGRTLYVECVCIDSGGHHTDEVYKFCRTRTRRRVGPAGGRWTQHLFAVKGGTEVKLPLVGRPSRHNRYRTPLYVLCTDTGKGTIIARLRIPAPGPGYIHLPEGLDAEYCEQLTSEKAIWRYSKGHTGRVWKKQRERNEAFDLEVYALAALKILGEPFIRELGARAQAWAQPPAIAAIAATAPIEAPSGVRGALPLRRPRPGWVDAWRK